MTALRERASRGDWTTGGSEAEMGSRARGSTGALYFDATAGKYQQQPLARLPSEPG
jgi:hypothetical protein